MMGKKKVVKKTKEVSVAIAEASVGTEPHTPRKRGRPRKVVDKETAQELEGTASKKPKSGKEEEGEVEDKVDKEKRLEEIKELVGSSSKSNKEEEDDEEKESSPKKQQRKSRTRKKGKPRKSS